MNKNEYYNMTYNEFIDKLKYIPNIRCNPLNYVFENDNIISNSKESLLMEFGVFQGNTINYIAEKVKDKVYGFDSFEGLPEKWDRPGAMYDKGAFSNNGNFPNVLSNVVLIKGWFSDTLPRFILSNNSPIKFIHVDCDIYSSTKTIFDLLENNIENNCVIVFDELINYQGFEGDGELKAFYEFVTKNKIDFEYIGMNGVLGNVGCGHERVAIKILNNPVFKK